MLLCVADCAWPNPHNGLLCIAHAFNRSWPCPAQNDKAEMEREFEEIKHQLEEDADREIEELKEKYEQKLQVRGQEQIQGGGRFRGCSR